MVLLTVPIKLAGVVFIAVLLLSALLQSSVDVNGLVYVDFELHRVQPCGYC